MIVVPFKIGDYVKARLVNNVGLEHWNLINGLYASLQYMENSGTFWTLWDGDEVVIIAGWHTAWEGVCEVALFPTDLFVKNPFPAVKRLKQKLQELTKTYRRIQLNCRHEEKFLKFAKRLGFKQEGILRKFSYDGQDHVIMSIVR